jgi:hypothetical protein
MTGQPNKGVLLFDERSGKETSLVAKHPNKPHISQAKCMAMVVAGLAALEGVGDERNLRHFK